MRIFHVFTMTLVIVTIMFAVARQATADFATAFVETTKVGETSTEYGYIVSLGAEGTNYLVIVMNDQMQHVVLQAVAKKGAVQDSEVGRHVLIQAEVLSKEINQNTKRPTVKLRIKKAWARDKRSGMTGPSVEGNWSDKTIDFRLRIFGGTAAVPFVGEIMIKNKTDKSISVPSPMVMPLCGDTDTNNIRVADPQGQSLDMTGIHADYVSRPMTEIPAESSKVWRFQLEKWFPEIVAPGNYQIEPWYFSDDDSWTGRVKMKALKVERKVWLVEGLRTHGS